MKIETIDIAGFVPSMRAMRNPMDSWDKSDSIWMTIGEADKFLSSRLQSAGPEHCKHLRMIEVWADIWAPRYWWTEFDTYRIGVEKVSCSTMHKLMARPLTAQDFECECCDATVFESLLKQINADIELYRQNKDKNPDIAKQHWREAIQLLPQSYIQKRTVMMSYAALRNIYKQREGHKLKEWQMFRSWIEKLPESWMIVE